jgi:hypothetical protein
MGTEFRVNNHTAEQDKGLIIQPPGKKLNPLGNTFLCLVKISSIYK